MQRWGGTRGQAHDLFLSALGHPDCGPRATPPPKWKERRRKAKTQKRGTAGTHQKPRVGSNPVSAHFPLSRASSIPATSCKGLGPWSSSACLFLFSFDLLPFSGDAARRWRLISVTVTMAFLLDLLFSPVLPHSSTDTNQSSLPAPNSTSACASPSSMEHTPLLVP
jgi:hypothetical protein